MIQIYSYNYNPFYKEEGTFTEWAIRFDKPSKPQHWTTLGLYLSGSDSGNPRALLLSASASCTTVWVPCRARAGAPLRVKRHFLPYSECAVNADFAQRRRGVMSFLLNSYQLKKH